MVHAKNLEILKMFLSKLLLETKTKTDFSLKAPRKCVETKNHGLKDYINGSCSCSQHSIGRKK